MVKMADMAAADSRRQYRRQPGWVKLGGLRFCHCEERPVIPSSSRDVAIWMRLNTRLRTAVATMTRLPRYARNDKVGTHEKVGTREMGGPLANPYALTLEMWPETPILPRLSFP